MITAFVDASVFYSACLSATGASREIIQMALRGEVILYASDLVREETERNLAQDHPEALPALELFWESVPFRMDNPTAGQVKAAAAYTHPKDAAIVAAAMRAKVGHLVSLDRKHLVGKPELEERSGLRILLPGDFLEEVRRQGSA